MKVEGNLQKNKLQSLNADSIKRKKSIKPTLIFLAIIAPNKNLCFAPKLTILLNKLATLPFYAKLKSD